MCLCVFPHIPLPPLRPLLLTVPPLQLLWCAAFSTGDLTRMLTLLQTIENPEECAAFLESLGKVCRILVSPPESNTHAIVTTHAIFTPAAFRNSIFWVVPLLEVRGMLPPPPVLPALLFLSACLACPALSPCPAPPLPLSYPPLTSMSLCWPV
jgi:hypothetical protein